MAGLPKAPAFGSVKVNLLLTATQGAAVGRDPGAHHWVPGLCAM